MSIKTLGDFVNTAQDVRAVVRNCRTGAVELHEVDGVDMLPRDHVFIGGVGTRLVTCGTLRGDVSYEVQDVGFVDNEWTPELRTTVLEDYAALLQVNPAEYSPQELERLYRL